MYRSLVQCTLFSTTSFESLYSTILSRPAAARSVLTRSFDWSDRWRPASVGPPPAARRAGPSDRPDGRPAAARCLDRGQTAPAGPRRRAAAVSGWPPSAGRPSATPAADAAPPAPRPPEGRGRGQGGYWTELLTLHNVVVHTTQMFFWKYLAQISN